MEALRFTLNAIAPIILMVLIGYLLKRSGFIRGEFTQIANKLLFHVFLPITLFLNVYDLETIAGLEIGYIIYTLSAILLIFLLSIPVVMRVTDRQERRGVLLQVTFRSNHALIGISLAEAVLGGEGAAAAALLSATVIPLFNVLAILSLSMFRGDGSRPDGKKLLLDIAKNPLILSIAAGLAALGIRAIFVRAGISFRLTDLAPIYAVLDDLASLTTPLALLVLGAQFEFSAIKSLRREIVFGTLMRTAIVPLLGLGTAYLLFRDQFSGAQFAALISIFATPVAVSSVPMAQEMGGDVPLAGQLIVWTTLCSALSIFLATFLLRLAGVFG